MTKQRQAVETLMGHVMRGLIRYEGALQDFLARPTEGHGLAEAEADDHRDALARLVMDANRHLMRDLSQLREFMKDEGPPAGGGIE